MAKVSKDGDGRVSRESLQSVREYIRQRTAPVKGQTEGEPPREPDAADDRVWPVLDCMADIHQREVQWLWPGRIPAGRITLLVGRPGEGKSFLTIDMAARVSTGTPWPDGSKCSPGPVLMLCAEDDAADTVRPRLAAHRADLQQVHTFTCVRHVDRTGWTRDRMFTLADVNELEQVLQHLRECKLLVIDPIGSYLSGKINSHRESGVRSVLAPLARLAQRFGVAVVLVAHRRKSRGDFADDLAIGSRAFTGMARAVWHVTRDRENPGRRLLLPGKANLSAGDTGLAFRIAGEPAAVCWEQDLVPLHADDGLEMERHGPTPPVPVARERAAAEEWLLRELANHSPKPVAEIRRAADQAGIGSWRTIQRAAVMIGVEYLREDVQDPYFWRLPQDDKS